MSNISAAMVKELRERTGLGMMECKKALVEAQGDIEQAIDELRKSSGMKAAKKADRTAADGVVALRLSDDATYGVIVEVNSETDFVARDANFLDFVDRVADKVMSDKITDVASLLTADIESDRQALVQKIGENISIRRIFVVEGAVVDGYVHSNNRMAALVSLNGGNPELAKDVAMHITAVNPRVIRPADMPEEELNREKEIIMAQPDMEGKPQEIKEKMAMGRIKKFLAENSLIEQPFVKNPEQTVGQLIGAAKVDIMDCIRVVVGEGIEVEKKDFAAEVAEQLKG